MSQGGEEKTENTEDAKEEYEIGDYVTLIKENRTGYVRYVGPVQGLGGNKFYGIELDNSIGDSGNNGSFGDEKYFECSNGHGLFATSSRIKCKSTPPVKPSTTSDDSKSTPDTENTDTNDPKKTKNDNNDDNSKKSSKDSTTTKTGAKKKTKDDKKTKSSRAKSPQPKGSRPVSSRSAKKAKTSKKDEKKNLKVKKNTKTSTSSSKIDFPKSSTSEEKIKFACDKLKDQKLPFRDRQDLLKKLKEIIDDEKCPAPIAASAIEKFKKPFYEQLIDKRIQVSREALAVTQCMCKRHIKSFKNHVSWYLKKCLEGLKSADAKSASGIVLCVEFMLKKTPKSKKATLVAELIRGTTSRNKIIRRHSWQFLCSVLQAYTDSKKKKVIEKPPKTVMDVISTGLKTGLTDSDRSIQHESMTCLNLFSLIDEARGEKLMSKLTPSLRKVYMGKYPTKRKTSILLDENKVGRLKKTDSNKALKNKTPKKKPVKRPSVKDKDKTPKKGKKDEKKTDKKVATKGKKTPVKKGNKKDEKKTEKKEEEKKNDEEKKTHSKGSQHLSLQEVIAIGGLDDPVDLEELDNNKPTGPKTRNKNSFVEPMVDLFDPDGKLGGYDEKEIDEDDPDAFKHDNDNDNDESIDDLLRNNNDDIEDPPSPTNEDDNENNNKKKEETVKEEINKEVTTDNVEEEDEGTDDDARDLIESFLDLKDPQINWKMIEFLSKDDMTHLLMSYISRMPGGPKFAKQNLEIDVNGKIPETLPLYSDDENEIRATQLSYSLMRILSNEHAAETVKSFLLRKCQDICIHALGVFHPKSKGNVYHGRVVLEILLNHWPKSFMGALTNNKKIQILLKIALFRNLHQGNLNSFFLDLICYRPQQNNKIGQIQPVKESLISMFKKWKFMEYLLEAATTSKHGDDVGTKYGTFFIDMVARCASIPEASELFIGYENLIIDSFMNGLLNENGKRTLWHQISCGQTLVQFLDISSRPTIVDPAQAMAGMLGVVPPDPNPNILHPMFEKSLKRLHEFIPKMCDKITSNIKLNSIKLASGNINEPFGQVKLNCLELLTVSADFAQFQCGDVLNMLKPKFWSDILDMAFKHSTNNMFLCHFRRLIHLSMIFKRRFLKYLFEKCKMLERFIQFYSKTETRCTLHGYILQMLWDIYNHDQRDDEVNNNNENDKEKEKDKEKDDDDAASTGSLIVNEDLDEDGNPISPKSKEKSNDNENNNNDNNTQEEFTEEDLILRPNFSKDPEDQWDIVKFFEGNEAWQGFLIPLTEQMELQNNAEQAPPNQNTQGQDQLNDLLKNLLGNNDDEGNDDDDDSSSSSESSDE